MAIRHRFDERRPSEPQDRPGAGGGGCPGRVSELGCQRGRSWWAAERGPAEVMPEVTGGNRAARRLGHRVARADRAGPVVRCPLGITDEHRMGKPLESSG